MDRVPDYESVGCAFESRMAHHLQAPGTTCSRGYLLFLLQRFSLFDYSSAICFYERLHILGTSDDVYPLVRVYIHHPRRQRFDYSYVRSGKYLRTVGLQRAVRPMLGKRHKPRIEYERISRYARLLLVSL